MTISYRLFDFQNEDISKLLGLYEQTYGDSSPYINRWNWECLENSFKDKLKIFVAEFDTKLVGATTRLPFKFIFQNKIVDAAFSVNSMVHPDFRRKGVMEGLYRMSAEYFPLLVSIDNITNLSELNSKKQELADGEEDVINDTFLKYNSQVNMFYDIYKNLEKEPYDPYLCHKHLTNLTIKIVYS